MALRFSKVLLVWILMQRIDYISCEGIVFIVDSVSPGSIRTGPIETLEFKTIPLENMGLPVAVDYDSVKDQIYWTDILNNTINKANVDGTGQEVVLELGNEYDPQPDGLALDTARRHVYWTDRNTKKIERADLDGSNRRIILDVDLDKPRAIVVDPAGQHIYWTDWGNSRIERANLDGTERKILVDENIKYPNGIFVSFENSRIYWCDAIEDRIESTDLDGNDRMIHFAITNTDIHPFDLVLYKEGLKETFYWTDWFLSRIIEVPHDSNNAEIVGPDSFNRPAGMHVYQENDGSCSTNQCENGSRCRQLITGYQCACVPGYSGTRCEIDIDECLTSPCQNAATCMDRVNGYVCACAQGWTGVNCDEDIDECAEGVCGENADCTNIPGSYVCKCHTGHHENPVNSGRCEIIDNCDPLPCLYAGICINGINAFECTCINGFLGDICEFAPPDPCLVYRPCRNGATCRSTGNQFTCECPLGYTGQNCGEVVDWCLSIDTPCFNNGICSSDVTEFICACLNRFTGNRCEIAPIITISPGCPHPGIFENGHILANDNLIPDMPSNELYPSGTKIKFVCQKGYTLEGEETSICQLPDFTWSHTKPVCVESEPTLPSIPVLVGVGVVVFIIILILVIALGVVCFRKRRSASNELLNRHRNEPKLQRKEDRIIDIDRMYHPSPHAHAHDSGYQDPIAMNSMYQSHIKYEDGTPELTINRTKSIHIYEDISERRMRGASIPNRMPPPTPTQQTTPTPTQQTTQFDFPPPAYTPSYDVPRSPRDATTNSDYVIHQNVNEVGKDNEGYTELRKDRRDSNENHVYMAPRNKNI